MPWGEDEVRALLARITYKPGYRLELKGRPGGDLALVLWSPHLPDADGGLADITVYLTREIHRMSIRSWSKPEETLLEIVKQLCTEHEEHERKEWLKLDGKRLEEPHHL